MHDRKLAETALRDSEEFARSILESSSMAIEVLDADGRLIFMNGPGMRIMEVEDFAAIDPRFVDECHSRGVRLIGIDTPSVDPFSSKTLDAHHAFLRNDMAILENLTLDGVPDGLYELIALPLRLEGFDASPVRAVLRTLDR